MGKMYYCKICRRLAERGVKGENHFEGTRKEVRAHLVKDHRLRGRKNIMAVTKKEFGVSEISENTGSRNLE